MARICYAGKAEHRIPGIGLIGEDWIQVPDHIAAEHDNPEDQAAGWEVERDPAPAEGGDKE
jgi:hypothetical protein